MKKIISGMFFTIILGSICAFNMFHNSSIAGYTGSPNESTCSNCHGGGPAGTTVSITADPAFTSNYYTPDAAYSITITAAHPTLPAFGFDCEILTANNANAGIMANAGPGVQFINAGTRINAAQTTARSGSGSASWSFLWTAPSVGPVTFYVAANAVNLNGSKSGDSPASKSFSLTGLPVNVPSNTGIDVFGISLFPNPANDVSTLAYSLLFSQLIRIELMDINGKLIKNLFNETQEPGRHSHIFDLKGIEKGMYFLEISSNGQKISQKLFSVQ